MILTQSARDKLVLAVELSWAVVFRNVKRFKKEYHLGSGRRVKEGIFFLRTEDFLIRRGVNNTSRPTLFSQPTSSRRRFVFNAHLASWIFSKFLTHHTLS